jgi:hypothetical protein
MEGRRRFKHFSFRFPLCRLSVVRICVALLSFLGPDEVCNAFSSDWQGYQTAD